MDRSKNTAVDLIASQWTRLQARPWLVRTINAVVLLVAIALNWLANGALTPLYSLPVALLASGRAGALVWLRRSILGRRIPEAGAASAASSAVIAMATHLPESACGLHL